MQLGLIGLGKMGGNMRERLRAAGHEVVGYDRNPDVSDVPDLDALVAALEPPRVVWVMVPAGDPTRETVAELGERLAEGDLVIDGGNSRFTDDFENAKLLGEKQIGYVDCGVSGGVWGLENGYGLMCGGDQKWVELAMPIFDALRPEGPRDESWVHAGDVGAGHYAKMVHNGIEYGMMHAYAEGYELLEAKDIVKDVPGTFKAWTQGTVVRSWLLDLLVAALEDNPRLEDVSDYTNDSGEGRWTVEEAIALGVPMPVLAASLFARFASRQAYSPTMQAVSALRGQFGGHRVMTTDEGEQLRRAAHAPQEPGRGRTEQAPEGAEGAEAAEGAAAGADEEQAAGQERAATKEASARAAKRASAAHVKDAEERAKAGIPSSTQGTDTEDTERGDERAAHRPAEEQKRSGEQSKRTPERIQERAAESTDPSQPPAGP